MSHRTLLAALVMLVAAAPGTPWAQGLERETVAIRLGAYVARTSTDIVANAAGSPGSAVSFEDDLGMASSSTDPIFGASWRFAQRHRLELVYFSLSRSASHEIDRELIIDGTVYPVDTVVSSTFKSDVAALTYYYSLWQSPEYELALGIGVHNTTFKPSLSASAQGLSTSLSTDVPLPVLALRGDMRFNEHWQGSVAAKWFGLNYGDYDGGLSTFDVSVTYLFTKNWGLQAAYAFNRYKFDVAKTDWNGSFNYKFSGPVLALVAQF